MSSHMELPNPTLLNTQPQGQTHPTKSPSFANGVLKRHAPPPPLPHHPIVVSYKECLKNHAASLGGHALDGCGEFMPSPASNPADPTSLKCAACGCHRNFHRREPDDPPPNALPALEYHPLHRHHPPPPAARGSSPDDSPSPPPISSSFYPSAPHMLMALSHGLSAPPPENSSPISAAVAAASTGAMLSSGSRKRYRTKFTQFQKERMLEFAEKVEWKMQKREEDAINEFCNEVGVDKGVFKVWMHNNKNTFAKKDQPPPPPPNLSNNTTEISSPTAPTTNSNGVNYCAAAFRHQQDGGSDMKDDDIDGEELGQLHLDGNQSAHALGINGSSSS